MEETININWQALEYEEKNQGNDWFWALGIIVVAVAVTSIIYKNYFFALLIVIGGVLLAYFSIKKPETITYEFNNRGLKVKDRIYTYESIKHFWVRTNQLKKDAEDADVTPALFLHTQRIFLPMFSIPITEEIALEIRDLLISKNIEEKKMEEHPSVHIMERLGF